MTEPHRVTEVTIGEVYRLTQRIDRRLDDMSREMVGREEYESDQEAIKSRLEYLAQEVAAERASREAGDEKIVIRAEQARKWAIGTALVAGTFLLALVGFILDLGGGPT